MCVCGGGGSFGGVVGIYVVLFLWCSKQYSSLSSVRCVLCRSLSTVKISKVKYVVWSHDMSHVALLGRNGTNPHMSSVLNRK